MNIKKFIDVINYDTKVAKNDDGDFFIFKKLEKEEWMMKKEFKSNSLSKEFPNISEGELIYDFKKEEIKSLKRMGHKFVYCWKEYGVFSGNDFVLRRVSKAELKENISFVVSSLKMFTNKEIAENDVQLKLIRGKDYFSYSYLKVGDEEVICFKGNLDFVKSSIDRLMTLKSEGEILITGKEVGDCLAIVFSDDMKKILFKVEKLKSGCGPALNGIMFKKNFGNKRYRVEKINGNFFRVFDRNAELVGLMAGLCCLSET